MIPGASCDVPIVVIGRNEGERLKLCLRAANQGAKTVVYVDSGSTDGSAEYARSVGCRVVELDSSRPFTLARAKDEGFARVIECAADAEFVQFLDGDCELQDGWLERGAAALNERSDVAMVCGQVREIHPEASVFNRLCDLERKHPPGESGAAFGLFMARASVFKEAGGHCPDLIAGEDYEFSVRVRRLGWKILMIDALMVRHDAAMTRFSQWWQRTRRAGHAYAQIAAMHSCDDEHEFVRNWRRILIWGVALPVAALVPAPFTRGLSLVLLCAYGLQFVRIIRGCRRRGWAGRDTWVFAFLGVISWFPMLQGFLQYYGRRLRGRAMTLIEYK